MLANWFQRYRPSLSKTWQLEHLRAHCTIAVTGVNAIYEKSSVGLEITNSPKQARATKISNKGELNLVAATKTISVAFAGKSTSPYKLCTVGPPLLSQDVTFFCSSATALPSEVDDDGFMSMFWHVKPTHEKKEANLALDSHKRPTPKLDIDIGVPIMTNTKKINIGDVLQYYEERKDPQQNDVKESSSKRPRTKWRVATSVATDCV